MRLSILALLSLFIMGQTSAQDPLRIVSVGGANTEILYALGLDEQIVGTDTTSSYPEAATKTPKVGYMRTLSSEGVLSLKPNLIILTEEAGPPPVLAQLEQVGVDILKVKAARSIEDIRSNVVAISEKVGADNAAKGLLEKIYNDMSNLQAVLKQDKTEPRIMFILNHGGGTPMVAGTNTAADSIIALSGAKNVVSEYEGYKPLTPEAAVKMQPDYILLTKMGLKSSGGLEAFANVLGVNLTQAAKDKRIIAMDSLYLLGFGPRTAEAALKLRQSYSGDQS